MIPLKDTTSLCPTCHETVPATVYQVGAEIQLHRECPQHGRFAAVINSDSRYYYLSQGAGRADESARRGPTTLPILATVSTEPESASCCGGSSAGAASACCGGVENLSTCVALIEIVQSCNLSCPVCFADSPQKHAVDSLGFDEFCQRVSAVIQRKGKIDILQLSGGEPTIHPEFFRLLEWALANSEIGHVLLNTNGIKLTSDTFFASLSSLRQRYGKVEIYLQYDGPQAAGQVTLRGVDLRQVRAAVIDRCQTVGIPVNLAMTVDQHNRDFLGDALQVALDHSWVTGITWQPMFGSGRVYSGFNQSETAEIQWPAVRRLNVADIIQGVVAQSRGRIREEDFTPLPCGDPNCHTVGYLLRQGDELIGLSALINLPEVQGFLQDRLNYNVADLQRCGCESEPLGQILRDLELGPQQVLRLVIKPFMDAWTYDQHRIDRCCVHVVGPDGRLDSFCRHYAMASRPATV
jgi:uncharacterized radical SAM superfamily Fe-S cluster-containing enzyme